MSYGTSARVDRGGGKGGFMSEVEKRDGGVGARVLEGGGRGGDRGGGDLVASPNEDEGYYCPECENTGRFIRLSTPMALKEEIDAQGRVIANLGYVADAEPDPEIRCGRCDQVITE